MPKEYSRSERVADFIKREVALLLQRELRDPRVSNANVNAVVVATCRQLKYMSRFLIKRRLKRQSKRLKY